MPRFAACFATSLTSQITLKGYQRSTRSKAKHDRLIADLSDFYELDGDLACILRLSAPL